MLPRHQTCSTTSGSPASIAKHNLKNLADIKKELDKKIVLDELLRGFSKVPTLHERQNLREVTGFSLEKILELARRKFDPKRIAAENEHQRRRYWEAKGLSAPKKVYNTMPKEHLDKLKLKYSNYVLKNECKPSLKIRKMWAKSVPGGMAALTDWARKTACCLPKGNQKPKSTIIRRRREENSGERSVSNFIQGDEYNALFESEDEEGDSDVEEQMATDDTYMPGKIEVNGEQRQSSRLLLKTSICSSTNNIPESIVAPPATTIIEEIPVRGLRDRGSRKPLSEISSLKLSKQEIVAMIKCMRQENADNLGKSMGFFKSVCESIADVNLKVFEKPTLKLYSTDVFLPLYRIISMHNEKKAITEHVALISHALLQHAGSISSGMCFEEPGCTKFVYPICRDNHFSILFFDKGNRTVTHADSYPKKNIPDAEIKCVAAKLEMEVNNIIRLDDTRVTKQTLTNSCGVHTVGFCHLFLNNGFEAPKVKMNVDAPALRKQMRDFIHDLNGIREKVAE